MANRPSERTGGLFLMKKLKGNKKVPQKFGDMELFCYLCIVHLKQAIYEVF